MRAVHFFTVLGKLFAFFCLLLFLFIFKRGLQKTVSFLLPHTGCEDLLEEKPAISPGKERVQVPQLNANFDRFFFGSEIRFPY